MVLTLSPFLVTVTATADIPIASNTTNNKASSIK